MHPGVRVRVLEVQRRRHHPVLHRQSCLDQSCDAGSRIQVADVRLDGSERAELAPSCIRAERPRERFDLDRIAELFQSGAVRAPEIKLYRLSEAGDAHRLSESRHFRGKLVFKVR